ncbi:AI-2E family transporter [Streptomyces sp. NPDC002044]|uniref:AI-2E family transporter n=1 Tax=Streptomyces sp. NPDC002044 TaxID=3154662 RepID=UPI003325EA1E
MAATDETTDQPAGAPDAAAGVPATATTGVTTTRASTVTTASTAAPVPAARPGATAGPSDGSSAAGGPATAAGAEPAGSAAAGGPASTGEPPWPADPARPGGPPPGAVPAAAGAGERMPRWLPRAVVLVLALVACFQLGSWAFHQLMGLLVNILIAFFLALAIEPAVARMAARGMRRGFATFLVFLAVFVFAAGFLTLLGSMLAGQIVAMVEGFPNYLDSVIDSINATFHTNLSRLDIQDSMLHSDWLQKYVQNSASGVLDVSATVLGGLFKLLTIGLFSFYFAADGPRLRRALCSVLPPAKQAEVLRAWEIAVAKTGGYLYSRGLMALISGVAHYILLAVLGVPYAPALAVWVGLVSQFIPTIGTYLAGALPMLIAFTVNPWYALYVLGFVVVYQQFENYVLQPKLTSKTVDIHPAVAFGSVIAGTALLGAVGALIAIPAVATLQAFLGAYVKRYALTEDAHASTAASRPWSRVRLPRRR